MNAMKGLLPLLLLFSAAVVLEARAPERPLLTPARDSRLPAHEPDSSVIREQAVEISLPLARDPQTKTLRLPLFGGTSPLDLVLQTRRVTKKGSVILSGRIAGQPVSTVVLAIGKTVLIGNIATQPTKEKGAEYYEIRYLGGGRHVLRQYDPSRLAAEADPMPPEPEAKPQDPAADEPLDTCTSDPPSTIDALVVYTKKAKDQVNGTQAMELAIDLYIQQANESLANSGVAPRIRLVDTREVDYDESGSNPKSDRNALKAPGGKLAEVHGIRDVDGADIVGLIVEYTKAETDKFGCGYAYVMLTVSNAFEDSAFAAVPRICADRSYSLIHEFGHLMGARHDWYVAESEPTPNKPFPFSHGYVHLPSASDPGPAFRTLMAKKDQCTDQKKGCDRILFWSNPDVRYPPTGSPMGVSTGDRPSNNARNLNENASTVANFRCSQP